MSVQLIVYPQYFDGSPNPLATASTEYIVDAINFNTVNLSSSFVSSASSGLVMQDAIDNYTSISVNTWGRYKNTLSNVPTESSNSLLFTPSTNAGAGIIQKLSNLTVGATYNVTLVLATAFTGTLTIRLYTGTILQSSTVYASPSGTITESFTANSKSDTILFDWDSPALLGISSISILASTNQPSGIIQTLGNGQVICDLYEDEDIPLTLSIDDFKNVAEKVQSYSKAFNLPATKRNNKIFDNMFEVTRTAQGDVSFNPYVKTQCVLKQDGFILFEGYLKMLDITDKEGEISYNVNLYSEVVALADILKDRTFSELDFTELTHDYNKDQIKNSWNDSGTGITYTNPSTSGFRNAFDTVKYPFVDWSHQILTAPSGTGNSATAGNPEFISLEQMFRPFIQVKYLINRIFEGTPFTWTSAFFNDDDFEKLYMDFNWGADNAPVTVSGDTYEGYYMFGTGDGSGANVATTSFTEMILSYNIPLVGGLTPTNYDDATNIITSTVLNESYSINYSYSIKNTDSSARTVECQWLYNSTPINNTGIVTIAAGATYVFSGSFTKVMTTIGDTLKAQFKASAGSVVEQLQNAFPLNGASVIFSLGVSSVTTNVFLQTLRGELGQWEFLKGIMTMFNLVTLPDEDNPNNIKFEPYADIFINDTAGTTLADRTIQHDWTDKVDVAEMKLEPLTDLNKKTIFKFVEDDDDFCFMEYKRQVGGHLYGSKLYDASLSATGLETVFQGTDEIVAEPFAATIIKPLMPQYSSFITPAIYASSNDETEGFDNSPRIMYNNGVKSTGVSYYIPDQNGLSSENQEDFLQFSHLSSVPTVSATTSSIGTADFHFGMCQLTQPVGDPVVANLFNIYWLPYYAELYNEDTRIMTIKVNLSPSDINTFKFNDLVMIKNRSFRVNKIDYKPNDLATVEFILIP